MKPRIFIGSSSEGKKFALAVQENLQKINECVIWDQGAFDISKATLNNLVDHLSDYDFAIFVLSPDDLIMTRRKVWSAARDNVIFEIGMFMGRLGVDRTFVVCADGESKVNIPTDLLGIFLLMFDADRQDSNWQAALGPASARIQGQIDKMGMLKGKSIRGPSGQIVEYAAALCYRIEKNSIEFLLVRSTHERTIFPKGKISVGENLSDAAMRYAFAEGRVATSPTNVEPFVFDYLKQADDQSVHLPVAASLVYATNPSQSQPLLALFRRPAWFTPEAAKQALAQGRQTNREIRSLESVIDWGVGQIRRLMVPRSQAGVVPYRKRDGKIEILLVTSRTQETLVFPKGTIESNENNKETAEKEAFEEAGIRGKLRHSLGSFEYSRYGTNYNVEMFTMEVTEELELWPEYEKRRREWLRLKHAEERIMHEHVKDVLLAFKRKMH